MNSVDRDAWIKQLAKGKSFADVGGLWNTVNEKISVAANAGATELAMIDIQPEGNEWWERFDVRMNELDVSGYQSIVADATKDDFLNDIGRSFDVVYCSGILYHLPSPYHLLKNLRSISNEYVILTSMTIPEVIDNSAGSLNLSGGQALFCPSLDENQKEILREHFTALRVNPKTILDVHPDGWLKKNEEPFYGPWWFLMTPSFIKGLARTLRFEVKEYGDAWQNRSTSFLLKKR